MCKRGFLKFLQNERVKISGQARNMASCVAYGCSNKSKRETEKRFFRLLQNPKVRKLWVQAINRTELPKTARLCSDHFTEECFDKSFELQNSMECYKDRTAKRRLITGSVPTLFPHKKKPNERVISKRRVEARFQKEVCSIVNVIS